MQNMGLRSMGVPLVTHVTTPPGKFDVITRHLTAMYAGDLDGFVATLNNNHTWQYPGIAFQIEDFDDWWDYIDWDNWTWIDFMVLEYRQIAEREYYRMEIKAISDDFWWMTFPDWEWSRPTNGFIAVWVLVQETPDCEPFLRSYSFGVTAMGGANWNEWKIFDWH